MTALGKLMALFPYRGGGDVGGTTYHTHSCTSDVVVRGKMGSGFLFFFFFSFSTSQLDQCVIGTGDIS